VPAETSASLSAQMVRYFYGKCSDEFINKYS